MPRSSLLVLAALALAACQQTRPIYNPPPGGHDALSKPPNALITPTP